MGRARCQFHGHLSGLADKALAGCWSQRAELVPTGARGGARRGQVDEAREGCHRGDGRVVPADQPTQSATDTGAEQGRECSGRGRQGVRRDQPSGGDDHRETRGQRGEHETVDADHRQRGRIEVGPGVPGGDQHDKQGEQDRTGQRADHQHPLPRDPVEHDPGERADDAERQHHDRERCRDRPGGRSPLRGEQHVADQARLKHSVGGL